MAAGPRVVYEFGPFRVDPDQQLLLRDNQPVDLTPKAFETLLTLVRRSREVVSKDELMKAVWPDAFVEEANLSQNIFVLRKALGDTTEDRRYIVTIPGRGYKFAAEVRTISEVPEPLLVATRSRSQLVIEHAESEPSEPLPALPSVPRSRRARPYLLGLGAVLMLLIAGAAFLFLRRKPAPLSGSDSVLIANFTNTTGNSVFDDTLRQGLEVHLEQSPFLSLLSEDRIRQTLLLMGQPASARLTPAIAREVCERAGGDLVLEGSIASLGSQYVLSLSAKDCGTGQIVDEEQAQVARKEDVINALGQIASRLRARVGESLASIQQHDTPLAQATTPSLEALKAYSAAWKVAFSTGSDSAVPLVKRAIEIDPQFAMAYAYLGRLYGDIGESVLSAENVSRAYQLRGRVSDRERFFITATYERQVTGNLEKARQTLELWAQAYPHDSVPLSLLSGGVSVEVADYETGAEAAQKSIELDPDQPFPYSNLAVDDISLGRMHEAENALQQAAQRGLDIPDVLVDQFDIAFLEGDQAGMERVAALSRGTPGAEDWIADQEAYGFAYSGHLRDARRMTSRAEDLAQESGLRERSAQYETAAAVREALFGNALKARRCAMAALALSKGRDVEYGAALALALAKDSSRSHMLADDLEKRFPEDTLVRFNYLPALRALLALNHRNPSSAIELLQTASPYELGSSVDSVGFVGPLYPVYVRGEAYLALRQGPQAAAQFQKILDHRGIVINDPIGALAHLQLARAYALSGDQARAKAAYRDFLTLWKNADPDIPILRQAKAEYAKLR